MCISLIGKRRLIISQDTLSAPWRRFASFLGTVLAAANLAGAADSFPAVDLKPAFPNLSFNRPLWMEEVPDGSKRLTVVEQSGKVHIFPKDPQAKTTKAFVDITSRKPQVQNEEGLLAFAFHPQYKSNGRLYLYYTQQSPKR